MPNETDYRKTLVLEALATGASLRDVAAAAGVSHVTVSRWAKAAGVTPTPAPKGRPLAPRPEPPPPEDDPEPEPPEEGDTLELTRGMLRRALKLARSAEAAGNMGAAQRAQRDAAALAIVVARLEKEANAGSDVLRISRADIDAAMRGVEERAAKILARPLLCAECSRALSVEWGGVKEPSKEDTDK